MNEKTTNYDSDIDSSKFQIVDVLSLVLSCLVSSNNLSTLSTTYQAKHSCFFCDTIRSVYFNYYDLSVNGNYVIKGSDTFISFFAT